jgi:dipeptidyl-peptidase-4
MIAAAIATGASAQTNVLKSRPANPSEGKMLTMEETILSRDLSPARAWTKFEDNGKSLVYYTDNFYRLSLTTGDSSQLTNYKHTERPALPEGAENPTAGKDGNWAYTIENGLYYIDANKVQHLIASDTDKGIVYGQTVSRNEFGIEGGIFWSPDGRKLAYYKKDQREVSQFPLLDITTRTGSLKNIYYPMAGMASEHIQLYVYDLHSETSTHVDAKDFTNEQYLTNITWSPDSKNIYIQVLDRAQKNLNLNIYDAESGKQVKTVLSEHNDKFVEPYAPLYFIKGKNDQFIYSIDNRDGYKSLYLCNNEGIIKRVTPVAADVQYVANDGNWVYYTSAEISPVENHLFKVSLKNGKKEQLTKAEGWHNITMEENCQWYVDSWSNVCDPGATEVCSTDGKTSKTLLKAEDPTLDYAYCQIDFGTVKSANGKFDNYYRMIKPKDFDPAKKYPVIVYVYGGPHSQMVKNTFMAELRRWEMYMAQRGYLVYVQDNRGTSNRGAEFEKAIHKQCGQAEMADQMEGIKMLTSLPFVDKDRIGVHGWSYGGFMTISLITNYPETFKVGVAGGPVIDWKWYEVMYGERYMENPHTNPEGFKLTSLINKAKDLKGKLLICQGAIDDVVLWEHSLSFIRECVKNNVQVDYFPYPCHKHNVIGKDRVHLMDKVSIYFNDYL